MNHSKQNIIGKRQIYRRAKVEVANLITSRYKKSCFISKNEAACTSAINSEILDKEQHFESARSSPEREIIINKFHNHSNEINSDLNIINLNELLTNNDSKEFSVTLKSQLVHWAINHKITQVAFTDLLHILATYHPELPVDCRSLLKTPTSQIIKQLESGEYTHFGIVDNLLSNLSVCPPSSNVFPDNIVKLSFNIDGLPLFHSNNIQFWPILGRIANHVKFRPFVIGIYCGKTKPQPLNKYLEDFIQELQFLSQEGFYSQDIHYSIQIYSFICDAPARSYIKCVKSHGGYSSCDKCVEEGEYFANRVILKGTSSMLRTDASFLRQDDEEHHLGITPLVDLQIGLVSCFPIDYMHAVCLGVMKKLLNVWIGGPLKNRLKSQNVNTISEHLISMKEYTPIEINRKPRELSELARWKATEFRTFLLYTGPIVLKDVVSLAIYEHFLLLHCGILILISKTHLRNIGSQFANELLTTFVNHCEKIYGEQFFVYNVHILCHLSADSEHFGPLDTFSAFAFESYLGQLKKLIKTPNKPLQQIYRRINEIKSFGSSEISFHNKLEYFIPHTNGPYAPIYKQFKKLLFNDCNFCIFSYNSGNSYCSVSNNVIIQIHNILVRSDDGETFIIGKRFKIYKSFYTYPLDSTIFGIYTVDNLIDDLEMWNIKDITYKCIIFPTARGHYVSFPLLHTF